MSKNFISTFDKKTDIANFCIMSLKSFNDVCFEKLEQIIKLFNPNKLFFSFEVTEKCKNAVCSDLMDLDKNSKLEASLKKRIEHIAYQTSADNLLGIFRIIEKYKLEESIFFEPKNFTWEQYLFNGTLENEFDKHDITNALFSVYAHDGYHHGLFRTREYNYEEIIIKIKAILD